MRAASSSAPGRDTGDQHERDRRERRGTAGRRRRRASRRRGLRACGRLGRSGGRSCSCAQLVPNLFQCADRALLHRGVDVVVRELSLCEELRQAPDRSPAGARGRARTRARYSSDVSEACRATPSAARTRSRRAYAAMIARRGSGSARRSSSASSSATARSSASSSSARSRAASAAPCGDDVRDGRDDDEADDDGDQEPAHARFVRASAPSSSGVGGVCPGRPKTLSSSKTFRPRGLRRLRRPDSDREEACEGDPREDGHAGDSGPSAICRAIASPLQEPVHEQDPARGHGHDPEREQRVEERRRTVLAMSSTRSARTPSRRPRRRPPARGRQRR